MDLKSKSLLFFSLLGLGVLVQRTWTGGGIPLVADANFRSEKNGSPQRIVSVNLGSDEILLSLAPQRIIAVSYLSLDPGISNVAEAAREVPYKLKADSERILALQPDLVVLGGHTPVDVVEQLKKAGLNVFRIQRYGSIQEIEETILELGEVIKEKDEAKKLVAEMRAKLLTVAAFTVKAKRLRLISYNPSGFTAGRATIFDDLARYAGGRNLSSEMGIRGFKKLSLENLLVMNPEVIITSAWTPRAPHFFQEFSSHPALQEVSAFKSKKVYRLPGKLMVTASHYVADGALALARLLHPELFEGMR